MKYEEKPNMTKAYRQEKYGLGCPRGYSNKPKPQNEPKIINGASAACSVFVILSKSSVINLN